MATPAAPSISHSVNTPAPTCCPVRRSPDEHLHRLLIVHVGDDTLLDESPGGGREELGWCAWCEEAQSPPTCAMRATIRSARGPRPLAQARREPDDG